MAEYGYCGKRLRQSPDEPCDSPFGVTKLPNGQGGPWTGAATADPTITGTPSSWNSDTTQVQVGRDTGRYGSFPVDAGPKTMAVFEAQDYANELRGAARSSTASKQDKQAYREFVSGLRQYTGSKLGTDGSIDDAWKSVLKDASRAGVDALSLLNSEGAGGGQSSGSGGGYSGPVSQVTVQSEPDIRATANALALEMIGRTLNDDEVSKLVARMRKEEVANPDVRNASGASVTQKQGLSPAGRQEVLRDVISQNPEFEKFQVDSSVLDATLDYVKSKRSVVDVA